ncbi:MAG: SGNH/GDSL hydrolase family protein [Betaproteobacteria bacterium]
MRAHPVLLALSGALVATMLVLSGCAAWRIDKGRALAAASEPFEARPRNAAARLLIVGDSTAVGTGATSPTASVAGRLSAAMPGLRVDNQGANGARFADVIGQLDAVRADRYDAVLVMAGGNDVIFLTRETELRANVEGAVARASQLAPMVVLLPAGNVGNAPFFFAPLSWIMSARSRTLHAIVREAAQRHGAHYVTLYRERADDPFARQPERFNAADGLHPSDDGYALWTDDLLAQSPLRTIAGPGGAVPR